MARTKNRDGIEKRAPGHYRVVIEFDKDATGRRRREYHTVRGTLEDAKRVRAKLMADKAQGTLVGRSQQTLGAYLESWLEWKRPRVTTRTYERYDSLVHAGIIPALGGVRLQQLTAQHLEGFYTESLKEPGQRRGSTLSPTTIHHRHVVLKMALKRAVEQGLIIRNPTDYAHPPKPESQKALKNRLRCLEAPEAARFLAASEGQSDLLPVFLALTTGARLGEILALRWSDLDLTAKVVVIQRTLVEPMKRGDSETWYSFNRPKTDDSTRRIGLDARTVKALERHQAAQAAARLACGVAWADLDLVIAGVGGAPVRPSTISKRFHAMVGEMNRCQTCEGSGVVGDYKCPDCDGSGSTHEFDGLRFHDLRHSHASISLASGVPALVVSERLGHSTVAFTLDRYGHVLKGQHKDAAEAFAAAVSGT